MERQDCSPSAGTVHSGGALDGSPSRTLERDLRPRESGADGVSLFLLTPEGEGNMNNVRTFVLMAGLLGLFLLVGQLIGGSTGLVMALVFGSLFNFVMYFFSDRLVLKMYRAQIVTAQEAPELYAIVDRLRQKAGLPMPTVAIAPHE